MPRFAVKIVLSKPWFQYSDAEAHGSTISDDEYETVKAHQEESCEHARRDGYDDASRFFEDTFRDFAPATTLSGWSKPIFGELFRQIRESPSLFCCRIRIDIDRTDISGASKTGLLTNFSDDDIFDIAYRGDVGHLFWDILERQPLYSLRTGELTRAPVFSYGCDWTDVEHRKGEITRAILKVAQRLEWSAERTKRFVRQSIDEREYQ